MTGLDAGFSTDPKPDDSKTEAGLHVNLRDILEQSSGIFEPGVFSRGKPFGLNGFYLEESPSFSDFNNLFNRGPPLPRRKQAPSEEVGEFSSLTGEPWTNLRSIFLLYTRPGHEGHTDIFGPVQGEAERCGLCQLYRQAGPAHTVTLHVTPPQPVDNTQHQQYEVLYGH